MSRRGLVSMVKMEEICGTVTVIHKADFSGLQLCPQVKTEDSRT